MTYPPQRGFALIVAVIFSSVVLAVGLALLDITYKQILLSGTAKNSQYAFYNADSALECALYWDQQNTGGAGSAFDYTSPRSSTEIGCDNNTAIGGYATGIVLLNGVSTRKTSFDLPCPGGKSAHVDVYKSSTGTTDIFASGYNYCDAGNPARIERGIKIHYNGS